MSMATSAVIRLLTPEDLDEALRLSSTAGWNQRVDDWRMLLRIAPSGSFTAVVDGRLVGTAIGLDYGSFGWIAMMLVEPSYRGRGLGARLLEAAMRALPPAHPIGLDATPMGRPLYQRYGFQDETMLTRHVADASMGQRALSFDSRSPSAQSMTISELPRVLTLDAAVFGGDRRAVLEWARDTAPQYAHAIDGPAGPQYCFGRSGRLFEQIGPVVAHDDEHAGALVEAALQAAVSRAVVMDVFDEREAFTRWLQSCGFAPQRPLFRMRRPGSGDFTPRVWAAGAGALEYAILGPEFG